MENPGRYFYPDQYNNPANWRAHYESTGPEICRQTTGRITHFVAVVGTSGTFTGTARYLKLYNPHIEVAEVQPDHGGHLVEHGVLDRRPYQDKPPRSAYVLTDKGRDLWLVVNAMRQWGDNWAAPEGPPVRIRHELCGRVVQVVPACSHCGERLDAGSVTAEPGTGAKEGDFDRTRLARPS